jgi:TRAP-type C4-dicarboxylate transport system permease small subunit
MSHAQPAAGDAGQQRPALTRWISRLSEVSGYLAAAAMVLAALVTCHGVFTRYVLRDPTVWQTEATVYLLMFVTFVGAAYGLKHRAHVGVDLFIDRLPARAQLVMRLVTAVVCLGVVVVVGWTAYQNWHEAYLFDHRSPTAWRFPLWIAYAIIPLGMLLVALQYIAMILEGVAALAGRMAMHDVALMAGSSELAQVRQELADKATESDGEATR